MKGGWYRIIPRYSKLRLSLIELLGSGVLGVISNAVKKPTYSSEHRRSSSFAFVIGNGLILKPVTFASITNRDHENEKCCHTLSKGRMTGSSGVHYCKELRAYWDGLAAPELGASYLRTQSVSLWHLE